MPTASGLTDRLFFALRPDAAAIERIEAARVRLIAEQGLLGRPLKAENLHLTLYHLGDFARFPQAVADKAGAAAAAVGVAPFEIVLDQAISFSRRTSRDLPCVLLAGEPLDPLKQFQRALVATLKAAGLYRYASFTPHLTLLYDGTAVERQPVEPIRWQATEFVLIRSLIGKGEHETVARWALSSPSPQGAA